MDDELDVSCLMVATMSSDLQKRFETYGAFDTMDQLQKIFQEEAQTEMCNLTKALMKCSMRDNESISAHMFKVTGYIEQLEKLGCKWDPQLVTNIIFASLSFRYSNFIMNYNMMGMSKSLDELLDFLKTAEEDMNKGSGNVLAVSSVGKKTKKCSECKSKGKGKGIFPTLSVSTARSADIGSVIALSSWRTKRTGMSLLLQVHLLLKLTLLLLFLIGCWTPVHVLIFVQICRH
jgi:gag-polypeptide of LTR copia-type